MKSLKKQILLIFMVSLMILSACTDGAETTEADAPLSEAVEEASVQDETIANTDDAEEETEADDTNNEDVDASHSKEADPDYNIVFPQDDVNEITISISEENWQAAMDDMEANYGGGMSNDRDQMGGNTGDDESNPIWVTADIEFEGEIWENAGFRFKGNSSLKSTWQSGSLKMPFKLDFDEFEDDYPEIEDQRFYGFKQLSFSSNFNDSSYMREKVAADIFRESEVPSAQTAYYAVYLEVGDTVEFMGLYTAVEVVDDTVIETQFDDDDGNVYKPDGTCATLAQGTYDEECYDKETNQEENDYSDLVALLEALHADTRLSDPEQWRSDLESVFNVDEFIDYLAVNTVIQNWDTYGVMTHNYYLYTDPTTGLINWIPWDNNESMQGDATGIMNTGGTTAGGGGGRPGGQNNRPGAGGGGGDRTAPSISLDEVNANWPLIRYIMDDDVYAEKYAEAVEEFIIEVFTEEEMTPIFDEFAALIEDYVREEGGDQAVFQMQNAVDELQVYVAARVQQAEEYLSEIK